MEGENNNGYKKGLWTEEEDRILMDYIRVHGKGNWNRVAKATGLRRCGKSCRLRWMNYLSPSVKRGDFSAEEEDLIIRLHKLLGNRWSLIAGRVPGRTDNQVKNYWNTHLSKRLGLRKEKCKKIISPHIHIKEIKKNPSVQQQLNIIPCSEDDRGTKQKSTEEKIPEEIRFDNAQEPPMDHTYQNSFWFLDEDLSFYPSNLMEYLDECNLDFVLHGL